MNKRFYNFFEKIINVNLLNADIGDYKIVVGGGNVDNYSPEADCKNKCNVLIKKLNIRIFVV